MSATKQKTTRVQSLGAVLPKAGFEYESGLQPFTASEHAGYVVFAMKEAKLCKTFIVPMFVDDLVGDMFQTMYHLAHTIKGHGIDTFWKLVCSNVAWVCDSQLISIEIVQELSSYMMEARLKFKISGVDVDARKLGKAATTIDNYLGRLVELSLHEYIPIIFEDSDGDFDEVSDEELEEIERLGFQTASEADLAVICEYSGKYDKYFSAGPYIPKWDENYDLVRFPAGYEQGEASKKPSHKTQMDIDCPPDEFIMPMKKLCLDDNDSYTTSTSTEQHKSNKGHKSETRLNEAAAALVANMKSLGLGPKTG